MKNLLLPILLFLTLNLFAGIENIPKGAFIMNMGITPQTIENGLKPYGLVYEMLQNYNVPIKWVINPTKVRDGIDFTYNKTSYKGGSFIILAQYRTAEINQAINNWKTQGVIGEDTSSEISVDVFATLTYAPKWTIDKSSGDLVTPFFQNAGIPATAHLGPIKSSWKIPSELTKCDDIFVLPHSDPTWATHSNLLYWNKDFKGAIWSGCHAVSALENLVSPDGLTQINFLTQTGMVSYRQHGMGQVPFNYAYPTDPIMQFINKLDNATTNGSEAIYLPKLAGGWRPGVKLSVFDPNHSQIPFLSPGVAAVLAYGYGFDDPQRGLVMYQGGHFHNGSNSNSFGGIPFNSDHVALQRAFFNFSYLAVVNRQITSVSAQIDAASTMTAGVKYPIKFSVPNNVDISNYQVRWSASTGTITPGLDGKTIDYTPKIGININIALITLFFKDACEREFFTTQNINIIQDISNNGEITVVRKVSANADGLGHDFLYIQNIELYPDNEIQIFNRWGIMIYGTKNYDNDQKAFKGFSSRKGNEAVIEGVYYYILKLKDDLGNYKSFKDYFILKR